MLVSHQMSPGNQIQTLEQPVLLTLSHLSSPKLLIRQLYNLSKRCKAFISTVTTITQVSASVPSLNKNQCLLLDGVMLDAEDVKSNSRGSAAPTTLRRLSQQLWSQVDIFQSPFLHSCSQRKCVWTESLKTKFSGWSIKRESQGKVPERLQGKKGVQESSPVRFGARS